MDVLETLVSLPQPIRILEWSRARKCVQSDMGALETSLSRLHLFRILGWGRGKKESPVPGDHLKNRFLDPNKVVF